MGICLHRLAAALIAGVAVQAASAQDDATGRAEGHAGHAHPNGDLVFFASAEAHRYSRSASQPAPDLNEDAAVAADIVLALTRGKYRLFGEYLFTSEEHDLERLQVGYEPMAGTVIWLGRFHQPASAWNTEHHHGRYLQTSVTRPSIELWEDEHGLLPQHLTGLLVDSRLPLSDSAGLHVSTGAGLGVRIDDKGLDPLDLLDMHQRGRRISWTGRVAWLPDLFSANQIGLMAATHRMPVIDPSAVAVLDASRVRQDMVGTFVDWRQGGWRSVAAVYGVRMRLDGGSSAREEHFAAGYLQVEHQLPQALTAYARGETLARAGRSSYVLNGYPDFVLRRALAGLRWDLRPRQALTVEGGRSTTSLGRRNEIRVQWSAAFP
jgi:hypothetical protein